MLQRIKTLIVTTLSLSALMVPGLAISGVAFAAGTNGISNAICTGVESPTGNSTSVDISGAQSGSCQDAHSGNSLADILRLVVNILSIVVGFVAVIMIIVAGFRYITSGGESGKVSSAKNAIVYAIIGLIIVALAQVIVRFVISRTNTIGSGA